MSQNCKSKLGHGVSASISNENDSNSHLITLPDVPLLLVIQNVHLQSLNHRLILCVGDLKSIQEFKCSSRIGIPFVNYLVDSNRKHRSYEPEFYHLHYPSLNDETVDKLLTSMPAISHLEVVISQVNICLISRLIRLLTRWASTLKWLKVCSGEFQPEDSLLLRPLIRAINCKLSVLEHLTLDLDGELLENYEIDDPDLISLDLPILGQLKEFFIQTREGWYVSTLLDTVVRQAGDQLNVLGFAFPFAWNYFKRLVNHPLASRFTLLSTRNEPQNERPLFPNLTGYSTHWHLNQPLNSVTSKLSSLRNLQYLELRRFPYEIVSVDSIQDHTVLQDDGWATLFPSVQIVNLIHMGDFCAKCYPKENYRDNPPGFEKTSERLSCLSQLLAPLTVLPSLRKIFYQRNDDLKNIAEFTGKGEFVKTHAYIY